MIELTGRGRRRRKQLLDDVKETRGYWKLKKEPLDGTQWGTRFGPAYGLKYSVKVPIHVRVWLRSPAGLGFQ